MTTEGAAARSLLFWCGLIAAGAGTGLLADCAARVFRKDVYQLQASEEFDRAGSRATASPPVLETSKHQEIRPRPRKLPDGILARLEIPAIGLSAMVAEGMDDLTLGRAVGHVPGTALPGQKGNTVLAAHRDTFFRGLRNIRRDDTLALTTLQGRFIYRVRSMRVITPDNVEPLAPLAEATATLITCYPFDFIGAAPRRFVVTAVRETALPPSR